MKHKPRKRKMITHLTCLGPPWQTSATSDHQRWSQTWNLCWYIDISYQNISNISTNYLLLVSIYYTYKKWSDFGWFGGTTHFRTPPACKSEIQQLSHWFQPNAIPNWGSIIGCWFEPLWKIWVRQLGWWHSQLNGKLIQMFQTTNPTERWHVTRLVTIRRLSMSASNSMARCHWKPSCEVRCGSCVPTKVVTVMAVYPAW